LFLKIELSSSKNEEIVGKYKGECKLLINKIKYNLQNMIFNNIPSFFDLDISGLGIIVNEFDKIISKRSEPDYKSTSRVTLLDLPVYPIALIEHLSDIFDLSNVDTMSLEEFYVLAICGLDYKAEKMNAKLNN
jgi:hypothetical protein